MNTDTGGYQTNPFVAQLYDQVVPYRERPDIDFFVEEAVESGGPVLEIGCGTGRVLLPTARAGINITGLDVSTYMLDVCRQALASESTETQGKVNLVEGDMRDFDLGRTFALVTSPFRPFQHLISVDDQLSCLDCVRRHLVPGGIFILDIFNPSLASLTADNIGQEIGDEPPFTTPDGVQVRRVHRITARDFHNQVQDVELIYYLNYPDGREERAVHAFPMRYLFRFEAEHLLARSGFEVLDLYADFNRTPHGSTTQSELLFRAKRIR
jgi:SAM-dependent methyltransferase